MNQIKLKIEEIELSQREISIRLGKNPSYLAGVFRAGLSTAKQAELLERLEVVAGGGTVQSDDQIIADLSQKLADCQDDNARQAKLLESAKDWRKWKQKQLTETQKYLLEANQECEHLKQKYKFVMNFNYVLCLIILGMVILWSVV